MKEETKFQFSPRPFSRRVVVLACLAAAMTFVASNSLQAAFLEFSANAYGTRAYVGNTVTVAKTAPVAVGSGCGTAAVNQSVSGSLGAASSPPYATTGSINTSAHNSTTSSTATADVHNMGLLAGLITAGEVKAVSTTFQNSTGLHSSAAGSSFSGLVIGTSPPRTFNTVPPPNTTIQMPGIGKVVLNEQILSGNGTNKQGLTVNMIHVYVTVSNVLGIPVGSQIVVAHAGSGLTQISGPASLDGTAFGTNVTGTAITSSPTATVSVGCQGNPLTTVSQAGVSVMGVLNSGAIVDTAQGSVTATISKATTTSTVQAVNLLGGLITASQVKAQANASTTNGTTFNFSDSGSSSTGLVVQGVAYGNVSANTKITLTVNGKTLGTLYLHRVIQNSNSITVRAIDLVIAAGNALNLPAGTHIVVGSASASLHSPAHP